MLQKVYLSIQFQSELSFSYTVPTIMSATIFGLSKERPILDHHAKAHIHEIRRISYGFQVKSSGFRTDFMKSGGFHTDFR